MIHIHAMEMHVMYYISIKGSHFDKQYKSILFTWFRMKHSSTLQDENRNKKKKNRMENITKYFKKWQNRIPIFALQIYRLIKC